MPNTRLPAHPDLEQLKRQAKELLHAARTLDPTALARFRLLPAFTRLSEDELARSPLALHDAQSVIAREHGFLSWKALRDRVEELTLEFDAAVVQFIEAATDGRTDRARRLLELHSRIADASFHTALILGDDAAAGSWLAKNLRLAHEPGGPRGWPPLLYLCHTSFRRDGDSPSDGRAAIARRLIDLAVDPNIRFPWLHHGVQRPALWGAICVTRDLPLAHVLLEAGADPNDGVTLPLAAMNGDVAALDLMLAYGADVNQAWATDGAPALHTVLRWSKTSAGVRWLLDHGADPDAAFAENGETPLHVVARAWDPETTALFASRGADLSHVRADGRSPYAVAVMSGNGEVADWLAEHGASTGLDEVDRLVGACSRGDRATAETMLSADPGLRAAIGDQHYVAFHQAAERGDAPALETMLMCGFDPDRPDEEIGKTALHTAAMAGWPDAVRVLLEHGASVTVRDREFHGQPIVWAAEGSQSQPGNGRDHAAVGRLLLDAGSPVEWDSGEGPPDAILDVLTEWRRACAEQRS